MIKLANLLCFWFLLLMACCTVTYGQNSTFKSVTPGEAGNEVTANRLTTQETSSFSSHPLVRQLLSDVTEQNVTQPTTVGDPPKETTVKKETSSNTFFSHIPTGAPPVSSTSQLYLSTISTKSQAEEKSRVRSSPTTAGVNQTSKPSKIPGIPSVTWTSIQSQSTQNTIASESTSNGVIHPTTHPQSTNLIASATTSSKLAENKSTTTSAVSGGYDVHSTILYKVTTPKQPINAINEKDREHPMQNPRGKQSVNNANHSKIVAGLIGGALVLMMVGFLVIYMKKRKLQRQQTSTSDWAGPSPFLESGADGDQVTLRSLNRISLSSFLPQRLSKRLSLLPETEEELKSMPPGNTFGDNHENVSSQKVEGNDGQQTNATSVVDAESKNVAGDATETNENSDK